MKNAMQLKAVVKNIAKEKKISAQLVLQNYMLEHLRAENMDLETLAFALDSTAKKRGSSAIVKQYRDIIESVRTSKMMNRQWENYRKEFDYAADIEFGKTCDAVVRVMDGVQRYLWG